MSTYLYNLGSFVAGHSSDFIFLLCVVILFFLYGVFFARGRVISLIISLYPSSLILLKFPEAGRISQILLFLIIFGFLNFVLNKVIATNSFERINWIESLLLAMSGTLLVAVLFYAILPLGSLHTLSRPFVSFFNNPWIIFLGLSLPFIALLYRHR
ncbi:MAG: hypothetical protein EXS50_03675 [Candidatus Taylorbacteria bacterium]|nr:hypothetical protein [Candidatus Taylorbacteria bacterium]